MADPSVADLVRSFELHLRAENKAGRTIETYLDALRLAAQFLTARGVELEEARREDIEAYRRPARPLEARHGRQPVSESARVLRLAGGRG